MSKPGIEKILWVTNFMPVLAKLNEENSTSKPLQGAKVSMSIHLEAKTAFLAICLKNAGAQVAICGSNPLSTQDDVCSALKEYGVQVYAKHGETAEEHVEHIKKTLSFLPDVIMDDGGEMIEYIHNCDPSLAKNTVGGCEETTTGIMGIAKLQKEGKLLFPMVDVNGADMKHFFDNRYGTGQSTLTAIMNTTNLSIASKTVVVAGYGWCGKGIAMRAAGLGAKVIVTEVDAKKAVEAAMDGFSVMTMDQAAPLGDFFITVTGCREVVTESHFKQMKEGTVLCNAGHFDVEVSVADLKRLCPDYKRVKPNIDEFIVNGKKLYLLGEGRLVNLAAGDGHPAEIMDLSFSLQMETIIRLWQTGKDMEKKIHSIPGDIDEKIAKLKLIAMDITIDELTPEQQKYLYG